MTDDLHTNPYVFYDNLRSHSPLHWMTRNGEQAWFVTGYTHAVEILQDMRFEKRIAVPQRLLFAKLQKNMMLFSNPPTHTRLREHVAKLFLAQVKKLKPRIQAIADHLAESLQTSHQVDIIADFAFPLTITVITELLGIPAENQDRFREWANSAIYSLDLTRTHESIKQGAETAFEMSEFLLRLIEQRKQDPKDDLISALLASASTEQTALHRDELLSTTMLLLIAGHETTVNLIGNSLLSLLRHPSQFNRLKENPALIGTALEECLRYESPAQMTVRFAAQDIQLGDKIIYKGQQVNVFIGAANRDPEQFLNPHQFDISRTPNRHLAFGVGIHACLGATLARAEVQIAILTLLQRFPHIRLLTDEPQWRSFIGFRGLKSLPVTFER